MIEWILMLVWMAVVLIGFPVQLYLFYRKGYVDGYQERLKHEELERLKHKEIRWVAVRNTMHTKN